MATEVRHPRVLEVVESNPGPRVVSPYVLAELDYLLARWWGAEAAAAAVAELSDGSWELAGFDANGLQTVHELMLRYRDQPIGLTDASLVVLAARYRTNRILTLDHRHFRVLRALDGGSFSLLPD